MWCVRNKDKNVPAAKRSSGRNNSVSVSEGTPENTFQNSVIRIFVTLIKWLCSCRFIFWSPRKNIFLLFKIPPSLRRHSKRSFRVCRCKKVCV